MIYPNELLELLNEYLTDRVITRQERNVLLRKAQSLGVDPEEFDLYIQAQLQKLSLQSNVDKSSMKGKKCPYCGEILPELVDVCPSCENHVNRQGSQNLNELIAKIEEALIELRKGYSFHDNRARVESYLRQVNLIYSNNPKVQSLTTRVNQEIILAEKRYRVEELRDWAKEHCGWIAYAIIVLIAIIAGMISEFGWATFFFISIIGIIPAVIIGKFFGDDW